ncbi:class I SAM-dependent methyltransferase [Aspergillus fijiensis CBS 313.89]|uniref:TAM domain methyltransferase n=1 Tax=Aspergillus fijiensis CBS 313.89 TaxID=1448319 RepID=A0A8G1VVB2_9EURO|nr:TAM domain methyltransferase [Aspergillus fijiensis CBS 313.89]RAK73038.1 TAM domain methyltransferase [Aspergillus fijiensis CBS 313.89]
MRTTFATTTTTKFTPLETWPLKVLLLESASPMAGARSAASNREDETQSLTASVTDYPMEHGRRYHKYHEGSYLYPNDEQELDRMDMQHHMLRLVNHGRLYFAPVQRPKRILDIGTGSGIWAIEIASDFPEAEITGTDLSPVQPLEVPENVHFLVDDATEEDWLWDPDHFDFIHTGHLIGSLPSYKDLLKKAHKHLKPGGYVECHEFDSRLKCDDGTMPPEDPDKFSDYALQDLMDLHYRSGQVSDPPRQFRVAHRLARWMREVGFEDVQEHRSMVPVNPWSSDPHLMKIGTWSETNLLEAVAGWSYKPLTILGWSKPEIEVFLVDVRKSIQNRNVHAYYEFYAVTGRKPLAG